MKKKTRTIALMTVVLAVLLGSLSGCKPKEENSSTVSVTSGVDVPKVDLDKTLNLLTGERNIPEESAGKRPVAVMINNLKKAWPQSGIGGADILYEVEVEGGITRLLAVFANTDKLPEKLGSVRSSRPYFINMAGAHDAIYVGHGWSNTARDLLVNKKSVDFINGMIHGAAFYRDKDKAKEKGSEHSSYTSKEKLQSFIKSKKMRDTESEERKNTTFMNFRDADKPVAAGEGCDKLTVPFSNYATSVFTYDPLAKAYAKSEFSQDHIDEATGKTLTFTNVLVLFLPSGMEDNKHLTFNFQGGSGYYASNGAIQPIKWTKGNDVLNPFVFTDDNGQILEANAGKTMVCLVKDSRTDKVKYTGGSSSSSSSAVSSAKK